MRVKQLRKRGIEYIKTPQEPSKDKFAFGKYIYMGVLIALVWFSGQWFYERYFFINGVGFLECDAAFVEARVPGRIEQIQRSINDSVAAGEPIVVLGNPAHTQIIINNNGTAAGSREDQRKIIDLESRIELLKLDVAKNTATVTQLHDEYARGKELFAAKAITRPHLRQIGEKLKQAQFELSAVKIKLQSAEKKLATYRGQLYLPPANGETGDRMAVSLHSEGVLYAPQSGIVAEIYKQVGEIAQIGEPILKIVNRKRSYVRTYFASALEKVIQAGDEVNIVFEDGEQVRGVIQKIYPTAFKQPNEKRFDIELVERYIVAEVVPADGQVWERVLETKVNVSLKRRWALGS